jgi:hypothetical protein
MNLTPHATAGHWAADYIGRVWKPPVIDKETGAVIERGFNCWHMTQDVQLEVFDRDLPDLPIGSPEDQTAKLIEITKGWRRMPAGTPPVEGDLLTMVCDLGPHVGVMIDGERVLHNVGGVDEKKGVWGSVRVDAVRDLGNLKYGHFKLWRAV